MKQTSTYFNIKTLLKDKEIYRVRVVFLTPIDAQLLIYLRDYVDKDKYGIFNKYKLYCSFHSDNIQGKFLGCLKNLQGKACRLDAIVGLKIRYMTYIYSRRHRLLDNSYVIEMTDGQKFTLISNMVTLNYDLYSLKSLVNNPLTLSAVKKRHIREKSLNTR